MKLVILGGGVAGVVAARYAIQQGFNQVTILEKDSSLGGLHRDVVIDDLHFDIGAFLFWHYHQLIQMFPEVREALCLIEDANFLSLTEKGSLDIYPPTVGGYIRDWGIPSLCIDTLKLVLSRAKISLSRRESKSVDDEMEYYLGPFYEKLGLKRYISRLYGMPASDVGLQFFKQRLEFIKDPLSFKQLLRKFISGRLDDLSKGMSLRSVYARPASGFSAMYDQIFEELKHDGVNIHLNAQVQSIQVQDKQVILSNGEIYEYDYLMSSIPLGIFCKLCNISLNLKLKFKPLYSLFYAADQEEVIPDCHVLFNFTQRGLWKRITFHSSYYGLEQNQSYFVVESMPDDNHLSDPDATQFLDKDFKDTFRNTPWNSAVDGARFLGSCITPNAYPIFDTNFNPSAVEKIAESLAQDSIYLIGRQGKFDYLNSSDAALSSVQAINSLLGKSN